MAITTGIVLGTAAAVTAGVTTYSAVKGYKAQKDAQNQAEEAQEKALKQQKAELERQQRVSQVQEIKQYTLDTMQNVDAPEWIEFYDYAVDHPDEPDLVKNKSDETITKYKARMKEVGIATLDLNTYKPETEQEETEVTLKKEKTELQLQTLDSKKQVSELQHALNSLKNQFAGFQIPAIKAESFNIEGLKKYAPAIAAVAALMVLNAKKGGK